MPPEELSACCKVYLFFSSWTINGPEIPILGCIVYYWDRGTTPHHKKSPAEAGLIPRPIDQNWCAHWRNPMDMMRQG
jgi:hypothetical protein